MSPLNYTWVIFEFLMKLEPQGKYLAVHVEEIAKFSYQRQLDTICCGQGWDGLAHDF